MITRSLTLLSLLTLLVAPACDSQHEIGLAADPPDASDAGPDTTSDARSLVASISQSASTNTSQIDVAVYSDGSAARTVGVPRFPGTDPRLNPPDKTYPAGSPEVVQFLSDLAAVGNVSTLGDPASSIGVSKCPKSASFGTQTRVTANGKTSGDLQCLDAPPPAATALALDCDVLLKTTP